MTLIQYAIARKAKQLLDTMKTRDLDEEEKRILAACTERVLEYEKEEAENQQAKPSRRRV